MFNLSNNQSKTTIFSFIISVPVLFAVIIAIVALSVIPVYLPAKSVTLNSNTRQSNEITIYLNTGIPVTERRKRQAVASSSIGNCIGCKIPPSNLSPIEKKLNDIMKQNNNARTASVTSGTVQAVSQQERSLSPKFQSLSVILVVKFHIVYEQRCSYSCQVRTGPQVRTAIETDLSLSNFNLTNVPLYTSTEEFWGILDSIPIVGVSYVSPIVPASTSSSLIAAPATVSISTTAFQTSTIGPIVLNTTVTTNVVLTNITTTTSATSATNSTTVVSPPRKECQRTFISVVHNSISYDSRPRSFVVADLNQDTQLDLVVTGSGTDNIAVFYGYGNGTFSNQTIFSTGAECQPYSVAVGDFDQDNRIDIIVACHGTKSLALLSGLDSGIYLLERTFSLHSSSSMSIVAADFNHDGRLDVAVANYDTSNVSIHLGSGDGFFEERTTYWTGYDSLPYSLAIGDANDDTHMDIVVVNSGTSTVGILLGLGNGSFTMQQMLTTGYRSYPLSVSVGDINNDTHLDIVVANPDTDNIGVFFGYGNGTFQRVSLFSTGSGSRPISVTIGYFTDDDQLDIAVVTSNTSAVIIVQRSLNGSFSNTHIDTVSSGSDSQYIGTGDFNNDHRLDIAVSNDVDNHITLLLQYSSKQFANPKEHPTSVGFSPNAIVAGYFNNDTDLDIAYSDSDSNQIGISLGNGDGTFSFLQTYYTGNNTGPYMLTTGDFDNDTILDLAFPNIYNDSVGVYFGDGKGYLTTFLLLATEYNSQARCLAVGDFNNDGTLDIAVSNSGVDTVGVFLGDGNRKFSSEIKSSTGSNSYPTSLAIGDFNQDNRLDIAITAIGYSSIIILFGSGDGNFMVQAIYFVSDDTCVMTIAVDDFNKDGHLDIALLQPVSNRLSIYIGSKNGTFNLTYICSTEDGSTPYYFVVGDFDNDSELDLAFANWGTGTISVFFGSGNGSFLRQSSYPIGDGSLPLAIAKGNFNNDQWLDVVITNSRTTDIDVVLGLDIVDKYNLTIYSTGSSPHSSSVSVGDFNNDNLPDIAIANTAHGNVGIRLGLVTRTFGPEITYSTKSNSYPAYLTTDDLNNDNLTDILVANTRNDSIVLLLGYRNGSFETQEIYPTGTGSHPSSIIAGDFNNDKILDLVVANQGTNNIGLFLGIANPTFEIKEIISTGCFSRPIDIVCGDFNGDHRLDVAVVSDADSNMLIFLGKGDGTFTNRTVYSTGINAFPVSIATGDFNNDTILDLAVGNSASPNIVIFVGLGNGTFVTYVAYQMETGSSVYSVAVGDFNNDIHLDIVVTDIAHNSIFLLFGYGNGTFFNQTIYSVGPASSPAGISVSDINKDGYLDIVVALAAINQVAILLGSNATVFDTPLLQDVGSGMEPVSVATGDFNMNSYMDIVVANYQSGDITILLDYRNKTFASFKMYAIKNNSYPMMVAIGDLNDDNRIDIAVSLLGGHAIALFFGYGNGDFTEYMTWSTGSGSGPNALTLGDYNSDGLIDIVVADGRLNNVGLLLRKKSQLFLNQISFFTGLNSHPCSVAVADFNHDGVVDIAVANQGNDNVGIFISQWDGSLSVQKTFSTGNGSSPQSIAVGDFNNDTLIDLAFISPTASFLGVLLGDGLGNFPFLMKYSTGVSSSPASLMVYDLNGDDVLDIAVANAQSNNLYVFYGNGNGSFPRSESYALKYGSHPFCVVVADFNQDNLLDIVVLERGSDEVDILQQVCDN
ncbi:unnamed protein product [Rotaria socialis]|uniref:Uncharacterized protein n=1 Tax=Rotaria socialis TaxID=392032 RepID=A0A818GT06_9BILA|nr:unnamed protein product [Rotaria socialis]CAF4495833.1 unnamed protein product [Rotaria socialis]